MEFIKSMFDYTNDLKSYAVISIMITIVGLIVRLRFSRALKVGMIVGTGLIGLDMTPNLLWTYVSPVANISVEKFNLNLNTVDIGWSAAAGLTFSTTVGSFIISFTILVNITLLVLKLTRTTNIDIWNYQHYALSEVVIYTLTGNLICAFVASVAHYAIALTIADYTAKTMQDALGVSGISIPQGYAMTAVPIYKVLDKIYDLVLPKKADEEADNSGLVNRFGFLKTLAEPPFLGLIIGILLGILAGYDLKDCPTISMAMVALVHLLLRVIEVTMEGLYPIGEQTREFIQSRFHGEEFYIGMDSAILLGPPTTMSMALLLILAILVLAMVLSVSTTLPFEDLVSTAYPISMATPIYKNSFGHILISDMIMMGVVLCATPFSVPMITQFAATGTLAISGGTIQVTVLSAENLIGLIPHQLSKFRLLGSIIIIALTGGIIYFFEKLAKRES